MEIHASFMKTHGTMLNQLSSDWDWDLGLGTWDLGPGKWEMGIESTPVPGDDSIISQATTTT